MIIIIQIPDVMILTHVGQSDTQDQYEARESHSAPPPMTSL